MYRVLSLRGLTFNIVKVESLGCYTYQIDLLLWMKIFLLDCQVAVMDFAQALETYSKLLGPDYPQVGYL